MVLRSACSTILPRYITAMRSLRDIASAVDIKKGLSDVRVSSHTSGGRVDDVLLVFKGGEKTVKAKDLRRLVGWRKLPSTDFTVYVDGAVAVLEGKGYGHGVGLCQWTALEMALDGKDYKEILAHFYPGAEITINEGL